MSKVAEFYIQALKDAEYRKRFAGIMAGTSLENIRDEQLEQLGELAREMGYSLTAEEARQYLSAEEASLSDEAMDAVAGGVKADAECKGENAGIIYINGKPK